MIDKIAARPLINHRLITPHHKTLRGTAHQGSHGCWRPGQSNLACAGNRGEEIADREAECFLKRRFLGIAHHERKGGEFLHAASDATQNSIRSQLSGTLWQRALRDFPGVWLHATGGFKHCLVSLPRRDTWQRGIREDLQRILHFQNHFPTHPHVLLVRHRDGEWKVSGFRRRPNQLPVSLQLQALRQNSRTAPTIRHNATLRFHRQHQRGLRLLHRQGFRQHRQRLGRTNHQRHLYGIFRPICIRDGKCEHRRDWFCADAIEFSAGGFEGKTSGGWIHRRLPTIGRSAADGLGLISVSLVHHSLRCRTGGNGQRQNIQGRPALG